MQNAPQQFQAFVSRSMIYTDSNGVANPIFVYFGCPYSIPGTDPNGDPIWVCQFQTQGFASDEFHTVCGVDGVHAIYLALSLAGVRVAAQPEAMGLDWGGALNFGFPPIVNPLPATAGIGGNGGGGGGGMINSEDLQLSPAPGY